ncbi:MAG TPA: hydrogenase maturation nickel metallochaperone HypA [Anaerohalosphaeraceae bacterium]|nr:hydrogenase maturation nickel metallochaperone HypA [Anaerohalosphaeraceae bacterium]
MHETAVAQSVLDTILEQADKLNARPVRAVISCGQFNALNDEAMRFAFEAAAEGTVCDAMELVIRHIPLRARCDNCDRLFEFDVYTPACPECKSEHFDFQADAPLLLEEIEFENPNDKGGL